MTPGSNRNPRLHLLLWVVLPGWTQQPLHASDPSSNFLPLPENHGERSGPAPLPPYPSGVSENVSGIAFIPFLPRFTHYFLKRSGTNLYTWEQPSPSDSPKYSFTHPILFQRQLHGGQWQLSGEARGLSPLSTDIPNMSRSLLSYLSPQLGLGVGECPTLSLLQKRVGTFCQQHHTLQTDESGGFSLTTTPPYPPPPFSPPPQCSLPGRVVGGWLCWSCCWAALSAQGRLAGNQIVMNFL